MKRKFWVLCAVLITLCGCSTAKTDAEPTAEPIAEVPTTEVCAEPQIYEATITAVGDDLLHTTVYEPFYQADGTYDLNGIFENLLDQIHGADISVINQETIMIDNRDRLGGYPNFGSPIEISDAIAEAGFNVVTHATNHAFDQGEQGIHDTLSVWHNYFPGMTVLGIHESQEQADEIAVVDVNNIKFALLNYTYGLNGYVLPENKKYLVDTLDDQEKIRRDLERAEESADVTVVFMHAGDEYHHLPNQYQKNFVNFMTDYGADIIIGAHPHVIEPYGKYRTDLNNSSVVFYSLGNFVSGQNALARILGGMANITVRKTIDGDSTTIEIPDFSMTALVTHQQGMDTTVYRLHDYNDDLIRKHKLYGSIPNFTIENLWKTYDDILNGRLN